MLLATVAVAFAFLGFFLLMFITEKKLAGLRPSALAVNDKGHSSIGNPKRIHSVTSKKEILKSKCFSLHSQQPANRQNNNPRPREFLFWERTVCWIAI